MYQVNSDPFCFPDLSNEIVLWDLINQIKRSMCANHKGHWDMWSKFLIYLLWIMTVHQCVMWNR